MLCLFSLCLCFYSICIVWFLYYVFFVFFVKQKPAYEWRISDWSSDVCSSDLGLGPEVLEDLLDRRVLAGLLDLVPVGAVEHRRGEERGRRGRRAGLGLGAPEGLVAHGLAVDLPTPPGRVAEVGLEDQIGRASCRERGCRDV